MAVAETVVRLVSAALLVASWSVATAAYTQHVETFVHVSDIHYDINYVPGTSEDTMCHRGTGSAGRFGTEGSMCDSPLVLIRETFKQIEHANPAMILYTGDSTRHDRDETQPKTDSELAIELSGVAAELASLQKRLNGAPIYPSIGNWDVNPKSNLGRNDTNLLQGLWNMWSPLVGDVPGASESFLKGGYYRVGNAMATASGLGVVSLNTLLWFEENVMMEDCSPDLNVFDPKVYSQAAQEEHLPDAQLLWLQETLATAKADAKYILIGHVPPITIDNLMLYKPNCLKHFVDILGVNYKRISALYYGHVNIDASYLLYRTAKNETELINDVSSSLTAEKVGFFHDEVDVWDWEEPFVEGSNVTSMAGGVDMPQLPMMVVNKGANPGRQVVATEEDEEDLDSLYRQQVQLMELYDFHVTSVTEKSFKEILYGDSGSEPNDESDQSGNVGIYKKNRRPVDGGKGHKGRKHRLGLFNPLVLLQTGPSLTPVHAPAFRIARLSPKDLSVQSQHQLYANLKDARAEGVDFIRGCGSRSFLGLRSVSPMGWKQVLKSVDSAQMTVFWKRYTSCLTVEDPATKSDRLYLSRKALNAIAVAAFGIFVLAIVLIHAWVRRWDVLSSDVYSQQRKVFDVRLIPREYGSRRAAPTSS